MLKRLQSKAMTPIPLTLTCKTSTLPAEQRGKINIETLNLYHCNTTDCQLLSLNGFVFVMVKMVRRRSALDMTYLYPLQCSRQIQDDLIRTNGRKEEMTGKTILESIKLNNWDTDPETLPHLSRIGKPCEGLLHNVMLQRAFTSFYSYCLYPSNLCNKKVFSLGC
jgi:hypothetical protein